MKKALFGFVAFLFLSGSAFAAQPQKLSCAYMVGDTELDAESTYVAYSLNRQGDQNVASLRMNTESGIVTVLVDWNAVDNITLSVGKSRIVAKDSVLYYFDYANWMSARVSCEVN